MSDKIMQILIPDMGRLRCINLNSSVTVKDDFSYIIYIFMLDVIGRLPYTQADALRYRTASSRMKAYPTGGVRLLHHNYTGVYGITALIFLGRNEE